MLRTLGLLSPFEAVVNSVQLAVAGKPPNGTGEIVVEIKRALQQLLCRLSLAWSGKQRSFKRTFVGNWVSQCST